MHPEGDPDRSKKKVMAVFTFLEVISLQTILVIAKVIGVAQIASRFSNLGARSGSTTVKFRKTAIQEIPFCLRYRSIQ